MKDIECPYCGHPQDINHDDGRGYEEGVSHQMECEKCEKNFVFQTSISFSYEPYKADCLNGSKHKYEITHTHPNVFSVMECVDCGDIRDLTNEERKEHNIGTKEDYFKSLKKIT